MHNLVTKAQAAQYISTFGSSLKKQPVDLLCETEISIQQHSGSSGHIMAAVQPL